MVHREEDLQLQTVNSKYFRSILSRKLTYVQNPGGGGVLPKKMGRGVRPASQNPYPIYEQPAG